MTAPEHFEKIDVLVFPGQGAFGDSARQLNERGLWEPLRAWLKAQKPYFGICLGYQLLFESSEENPGVVGLGAFRGAVAGEIVAGHLGGLDRLGREDILGCRAVGADGAGGDEDEEIGGNGLSPMELHRKAMEKLNGDNMRGEDGQINFDF